MPEQTELENKPSSKCPLCGKDALGLVTWSSKPRCPSSVTWAIVIPWFFLWFFVVGLLLMQNSGDIWSWLATLFLETIVSVVGCLWSVVWARGEVVSLQEKTRYCAACGRAFPWKPRKPPGLRKSLRPLRDALVNLYYRDTKRERSRKKGTSVPREKSVGTSTSD